ncbi:hypothetical protein Slin15195_G019170 [Septoria linicola]|uniref:Uncharacterized protein n=1 Tax=Septoria linicola TaxID=215465 RepID=A0A9Q9AM19_9PEZI|nr:hypothetical protein Slin15195_G019170 [Septoria linicola]
MSRVEFEVGSAVAALVELQSKVFIDDDTMSLGSGASSETDFDPAYDRWTRQAWARH